MPRLLVLLIMIPFLATCQDNSVIEIGTFNIEWFPCKDDGELMKQYGIELRYPPTGSSTDIKSLFALLKNLDIELLGVQEIVDPKLFADSAKAYLGDQYKFIYSPSGGSQKVGFLYDSSVLKLVGNAQTYMSVALSDDSRLRPAFRAYFKAIPSGFDFHAIVTHLKASPRGWDLREKQWGEIENIIRDLPKKTKDGDIVLLGDFNNVSNLGIDEFNDIINSTNFLDITADARESYSNYWQPDYKKTRIQASLIDHIFISEDAKIEFIENSKKLGGMCDQGKYEYVGDSIPDYYEKISDHCPVYASFRIDVDND